LVDRLLIGRKLADMETYCMQLQEFSKITVVAYKKDWKTQRIIERTLQMLIEVCIDIANHLISDKGMRLPTGYADTFRVLRKNKILNKNLCTSLEQMAKFRNIVVHQYEQIDPSIVIRILHKNLGDFEKYRKAIIKSL
jgi:uncharacterized protein YutE (UPF0331/DUF86 family)